MLSRLVLPRLALPAAPIASATRAPCRSPTPKPRWSQRYHTYW